MRRHVFLFIFAACLMLAACESSTGPGPVLAPPPEGTVAADASKEAKKGTVINQIARPKMQISQD